MFLSGGRPRVLNSCRPLSLSFALIRRCTVEVSYTPFRHVSVRAAYVPSVCLTLPVRGRVESRATVRLEGLGQMAKSNNFIGNRTRDLSASSTVAIWCVKNGLTDKAINPGRIGHTGTPTGHRMEQFII
jgi:hypothetical protein